MPPHVKASPRKREAAKRTVHRAAPNEALRVSSVDQIVSEIVRGLYEGRYVAGQKLTEADLTRRFGVGRGTVREALRRLSAEGLVTVSMHRGASIRALTREDVRDILEMVETLAGLAARLAAERITGPDAERDLRETMSALTALAEGGDPFEFARMRQQFYHQLAALSGNRELARLLPTVQAHMTPRVQFRAGYAAAAERQWVADHQQVIEAILAGDGARAERVVRRHVRMTAQAIQKLPDQNFAS